MEPSLSPVCDSAALWRSTARTCDGRGVLTTCVVEACREYAKALAGARLMLAGRSCTTGSE